MEPTTVHSDDLPRPGSSFSVAEVLAVYGWHLLILIIILAYLYKKAQPTINKFFEKRREQEYAAKYHKNPDLAATRLSAQEAAIQKLQAQYNSDASKYQNRMEEKEAKKREEWLNKQSSTTGHKLGTASTSSLKQDYNPLMGDTSSHSYRPQRKSPCSGGGCGR